MLHSQLPGLYIEEVENKGRAVFSSSDIPEGSTIEICPVILLNEDDREIIHRTSLHDYYFIWDLEKLNAAIALGYGSIYNHSSKANAEFEILFDSKEIKIFAIKDIPAGEEITINYQGIKDSRFSDLWFKES